MPRSAAERPKLYINDGRRSGVSSSPFSCRTSADTDTLAGTANSPLRGYCHAKLVRRAASNSGCGLAVRRSSAGAGAAVSCGGAAIICALSVCGGTSRQGSWAAPAALRSSSAPGCSRAARHTQSEKLFAPATSCGVSPPAPSSDTASFDSMAAGSLAAVYSKSRSLARVSAT
ncbi:hypothetical protein SDC9_197101 [bioreactor metagenome]|uniref:Uncharacterized protein n=1 Tax=bioreactor metagenome TaxID=1076179 RepID=A0A645IED1_9ZZZZ